MLIEALPARIDLAAYHGDTWAQSFRITRGGLPVDLGGASVEAWTRNFAETTLQLVANIDTDPSSGIVTISQPAGGLDPGRYGYDVQISETGAITTWINGHLDIAREIAAAA